MYLSKIISEISSGDMWGKIILRNQRNKRKLYDHIYQNKLKVKMKMSRSRHDLHFWEIILRLILPINSTIIRFVYQLFSETNHTLQQEIALLSCFWSLNSQNLQTQSKQAAPLWSFSETSFLEPGGGLIHQPGDQRMTEKYRNKFVQKNLHTLGNSLPSETSLLCFLLLFF